MGKKKITVAFKNLDDFRNRIVRLWMSQRKDEVYEFIWPDKETEEEFEKLTRVFT